MGLQWRSLLLFIGIALLLESNICDAGARVSKASAQTLARKTGAAHFEEHFEEISSESHEHNLKKRASDEDFDYEVYQGVVGRPGIDFPVLPRIPQTTFSCRTFGNGYFADLETECQVFHICDDGRKISFLCPNGTIFQQTELICDWWFKVNCAASPGHYAESAEMLSRAQQNRHQHRQHSSKRVENEFHSDGGHQRQRPHSNGSNKNQYPIKNSRKYENEGRSKTNTKLNRRIDSDEDPSVENYDFEDIPEGAYRAGKNEKITTKTSDTSDGESQDVAESASFVGTNKGKNGYNYENPNQAKNSGRNLDANVNKSDIRKDNSNGNEARAKGDRVNSHQGRDKSPGSSQRPSSGKKEEEIDQNKQSGYTYGVQKNGKDTTTTTSQDRRAKDRQDFDGSADNERPKNERGRQKYVNDASGKDQRTQDYLSTKSSFDTTTRSRTTGQPTTTNSRTEYTVRQSSSRQERKQHSGKPNLIHEINKSTSPLPPTTSRDRPNTYSTARKIEPTRTTPYYTPTIPTLKVTGTTENGYSATPSPAVSVSTPSVEISHDGGNFSPSATTVSPRTSSTASLPKSYSSGTTFASKSTTPSTSYSFGTTVTPTSRFSSFGTTTTLPPATFSSAGTTFLPRGSSTATTAVPRSSSASPTYLPSTTEVPEYTTLSYTQTPWGSGEVTSRPSSSGPTYLPKSSQPNTYPSTRTPATSGVTFTSSSAPTYLPRGTTVTPTTPGSQNGVSVADHVRGMIKTLQELKMDTSGDFKIVAPRPGLDIPPSSGPDTLHSLAHYFATSEDAEGVAEKTESSVVSESKTELAATHVSNKTKDTYENLFGLATTKKPVEPTLAPDFKPRFADKADLETQQSGSVLKGEAGKPETRKIAQVFTNALSAYLDNPEKFREVLNEVRPTEPSTAGDNEISTSTKKDFDKGTAATYLPTAPTFTTTWSTPTTTEDLEVLRFSDDSGKKQQKGTSAKYSLGPTTATTYAPITKLTTKSVSSNLVDRVPASRLITTKASKGSGGSTTEPNAIAMEVNKGLGLSTVVPYLSLAESVNARKPSIQTSVDLGSRFNTDFSFSTTTDYPQFTSTFSSFDGNTVSPHNVIGLDLAPPFTGDKTFQGLPSSEILPPEDEEDTLLHAQSQSFIPSGNVIITSPSGSKSSTTKTPTRKTSVSGHYITKLMSEKIISTTPFPENGHVSPNPWSSVGYTVFLDPLTINDGLMGSGSGEFGTTTPSPFTYLPKVVSTTTEQNPVRFNLNGVSKDNKVATSSTARTGKTLPDIPEHVLPPANGMQKMANKMFGGLNETSADHLMSVMKKAEDNKTVRRLILLLIQTCDDDYSKTVEQSRKALLNALIGMDGDVDPNEEIEIIKVGAHRRGKSIDSVPRSRNSLVPTTSEIPVTTYRRSTESSVGTTSTISPNSGEWTTATSTTDSAFSAHTSTSGPQEETTRFEIRVEDPEDDYYGTTSTTQSPEYSTISSTLAASSQEVTTTYSTTTEPPAPTTTRKSSVATSNNKSTSRRKAKHIDSEVGQHDLSHISSDERALELLKSLYSLASKFNRR